MNQYISVLFKNYKPSIISASSNPLTNLNKLKASQEDLHQCQKLNNPSSHQKQQDLFSNKLIENSRNSTYSNPNLKTISKEANNSF